MRAAPILGLLVLLAGCETPPPAPAVEPPPPEAPPADELEARVRARGEEIAPYMVRSGRAYRDDVQEGASRDFSHVLQPGWCYMAVAVTEGIEDLDLRLYDENDVLVQRDTTRDATPQLGIQRPVCPVEAATYRLEVRAVRGAGRFAVQVYRSI